VTNPAEIYDSYLVPAIFEPWSRDLIQRAKVFRGDRVLDVATGTGIVACRIAATGAKVTGVDVTPAMLAQAKQRAAAEGVGVTWVERSAESLPFAARSFDLVTCQQGLQFVPDRVAAVKEMRRVIAPGGRAVIACWAGLDSQPAYRILDEIGQRHFGDAGFGGPFALGDAAELTRLLGGARFHAVAVERVTRTVKFPEPARFVTLSFTAAAAFFPALAALDDATRAEKIAQAAAEATPALASFVDGDQLVMPMTAHIAIGRVPTE
jgi:SAM-dependent methyltransferase